MEVRFQQSPKETAGMQTEALRQNFLVEKLMIDDEVKMVYSHFDRVIIGGAKPVQAVLALHTHAELQATSFLERREIGIINVGGTGEVQVDGEIYLLNKLDCLYAGKGVKDIQFISREAGQPALFYFLSAPAHQAYPTRKISREDAQPTSMGQQSASNKRTIYKYIHADGIQSAQLVMGLTILEEGSVWNTIPSHTHTRRMEAYFYFDIQPDQRVLHFMGEPHETRHLVVANHEAIISPPWSIHSGCGTSSYGFIWGMAGENYNYADMDPAPIESLR